MIGQITPEFRQKLEAEQNWLNIFKDGLLIEMIEKVKSMIFNVNAKNYKVASLWKLKVELSTFKQDKTMLLATYYEQFTQRMDVLRSFGGSLGTNPNVIVSMLAAKKLNLTPSQQEKN